MAAGYLYLLTNPTMPGLAKVGKTTRDPATRVAELSAATGVATPFLLIYQQPVRDCDAAEAWVHAELQRDGHRVTSNREFFTAQLHEIVELMYRSAGLGVEGSAGSAEIEAAADTIASMAGLIELGNRFLAGQEVLIDEKKALNCFLEAAALGSADATERAAQLLRDGGGKVKVDLQGAVDLYRRAIALGSWHCYEDVACIFQELGQSSGAQIAWRSLFDSAGRLLTADTQADIGARIGKASILYFHGVEKHEVEHAIERELILPFAGDIARDLGAKAKDVNKDLSWDVRREYVWALQHFERAIADPLSSES